MEQPEFSMAFVAQKTIEIFADSTGYPEGLLDNAREQVQKLKGLWPLTEAEQLDNDVHYGDNLQVRQTLQIARLLLDDESASNLTLADAEYVFEGAEEIPGRDQKFVNVLLTANDAYEVAHELQSNFSGEKIVEIAKVLNDEEYEVDVAPKLNVTLEAFLTAANSIEDDVVKLIGGILMSRDIAGAMARIPVKKEIITILVLNEYLDKMAIPRIFLKAGEISDLFGVGTQEEIVEQIAKKVERAAEEWHAHYVDVTWNKEEAKRKAREEDELKSKQALAAKFAHIQDDPNKPEVEL